MSNRTKEARKVAKKIREGVELTETENLIIDNKVPFDYKKEKYRVRLPTRKERRDSQVFQALKYNELLDTPGYKLRQEWIAKFKAEKGIDIEEMDNQINDINEQIHDLYIEINETTDTEAKEKYSQQVEECFVNIKKIEDKTSKLLQYCIEDQITEDGNLFLLSLILEKKTKKAWIRVFKSFEEIENTQEEDLLIMATSYLAHLFYEPRI